MSLPKPILTYEGNDNWCLRAPYTIRDLRRGLEWTILDGYVYDLSSVPRILWSVLPPWSLSTVAPLAHDFSYWHGGRVYPGVTYDRAQTDQLFLDLMEQEGVSKARRTLAYYAVRCFGFSGWGRGKRQPTRG